MSLDISLNVIKQTEVFGANITHNMTPMAKAVGLYVPLWHPEKIYLQWSYELIPLLEEGITLLKSDPEQYKALNPDNGWGSYDTFLPWLEKLLEQCKEHPDAFINVSV